MDTEEERFSSQLIHTSLIQKEKSGAPFCPITQKLHIHRFSVILSDKIAGSSAEAAAVISATTFVTKAWEETLLHYLSSSSWPNVIPLWRTKMWNWKECLKVQIFFPVSCGCLEVSGAHLLNVKSGFRQVSSCSYPCIPMAR